MKCNQCNTEISDESNFCPNCGYHFPDITRGKSSFDIKVLKMIFRRKEKNISSEQKSSEDKKEINPKKGKWGWGWYILLGLVYTSISKVYSEFGERLGILTLFGVGVSLIAYFYFRNKVLKEISILKTRSFLAGFISYIITAILVAGLSGVIRPNIIGEVSKSISKESDKITSSLSSFKKEDALLWDLFIDEPSTQSELINNIKILDKSVPLYHYKDSVALSTFNSIYTIINDAENKYPVEMKNYPIKSDLILSLQKSYKIFSTNTYNKFSTLKNYYNALLNGNNNTEAMWNECVNAQTALENSQSTYTSLMKEFIEAQKK